MNKKILGLPVLLSILAVAGCSSAQAFEPISSSQARAAIVGVQAPEILISFTKEEADGADNEESDSYSQSFNTSSICNSVAELGQLTYQAGFGLRNKQSLPLELRDFDVREGSKFLFEPTDDEYVGFYVTLVSYASIEKAETLAAELKAAVKPCGDVSGDFSTRNTILFSDLDGENDFVHRAREVFEFSSLDLTIVSESTDYLVQRGAVIGLVHVGASENGVQESGLSREQLDEAALDLLDQAFAGIGQ